MTVAGDRKRKVAESNMEEVKTYDSGYKSRASKAIRES